MSRIFKPDSGQTLEIQDEGGSAALTIDTDGNVEIANDIEQVTGKQIHTSEIRAKDGDGLKLYDDSGSAGIFVEDGGNVGIGTANPNYPLEINYGGAGVWGLYVSGSVGSGGIGIHIETATNDGAHAFRVSTGAGGSRFYVTNAGNGAITGSFSKGSGSFRINHPLESKSETHHLIHSFIEGPQADLIYRGIINLVDGSATINLDTVSNMTEGTFSALCTSIQCFTTNETGWTPIKGSVTGNILTITANDESCTDTISWMVIGERQDPHMIETDWTDDNGKVIVEPEKVIVEPENA